MYHNKYNIFILSILTLFCLSACSVSTNIPVGEIPIASEPEKKEILSTQHSIQQHLGRENGYRLHTKGKNFDRVNRILTKITLAAGFTKQPYALYIADAGDNANALAVNGNSIVIYKKLIDSVPADDELATVIAHEVAHIIANHNHDHSAEKRGSFVKVGSSILGTIAAVATTYATGSSGLGNLAGDVSSGVTGLVGEGALVKAYDRKLEYEADHVGMMLMAKAGYHPEAAIKFWKKANDIFGANKGSLFFSTHPASSDRLDELNKALPIALEYFKTAKDN